MKKIILLAAAALALASCENNDDNDNLVPSGECARITATIGESVSSRAKDSTWSPGDRIGISSTVGAVVGPYTNLEYTTDGSGAFDGTSLFFYKPMTLTAYYPFTGSEGTDPGSIKVNTNAEAQKAENQPLIDFLWDTRTNQDDKDFSATNNTISFVFTHKMSELIFAFKGSKEVRENGKVIATEVKVSDLVAYEIEGLVMDGSFNTTTGICAINNSATPEKLKIDVEKGTVKDEIFLSPLIVLPQKPGNNAVKLHVYTDELGNSSVLQHYTCMLTFGDGELKPGNCYKYTIQITKTGLKLDKMSIINWNTEREVNLTASIDGGVNKDENN